jgi:hypothetical protein
MFYNTNAVAVGDNCCCCWTQTMLLLEKVAIERYWMLLHWTQLHWTQLILLLDAADVFAVY